MRQGVLSFLFVLAVLLTTATSGALATVYTFTNIPSGIGNSEANAINSHGQIVGNLGVDTGPLNTSSLSD